MKIEEKIYEIENSIYINWKKQPFRSDISLMTGLSGIPLFYYMLYLYSDEKKYLEYIEKIIEYIFEHINESDQKIGTTFSSGVSGIGFMLNILEKTGNFKNLDLEDKLLIIDEILLDTVDYFLSYIDNLEHKQKVEQIDFLHGVLGIAYYTLERFEKISEKNKIVSLFEKISEIIISDGQNAYDLRDVTEISESFQKTNLGLAHGHVSYILILIKFLEKFPQNLKVREALTESTNTILLFENDNDKSFCKFPSIAVNKKTAFYNIHLGWCYGDQSVSYALYKAGNLLKDDFLIDKSNQIALSTLKRNDIESALINKDRYDAGFCHGTASVAYNHCKWYKITKDKNFEDLYVKFTKETLLKAKYDDGLAGFMKYNGEGELVQAIGILDGITGIGVFLLDNILKEKSNFNWQSIFLLE